MTAAARPVQAPPEARITQVGMSPGVFASLTPAVFVLLWSTGFVVARFVTPHADPFTFLTVRFVLSAAVFVLIGIACRVRWPRRGRDYVVAMLNGALIHGFYLAGVFWAICNGLPAGVAALVSGLQPMATAVIAALLLDERLHPRQWIGIAFGFLGVGLVVAPALASVRGVPPAAFVAAFAAMLSITFGTVWQKQRTLVLDLRANAALQFVGAALVVAPLAFGTEPMLFDRTWPLWACLLWSVFGLSVGAISLLLLLLARDAATDVAALLYLVPPVSAVLAFLLLGETLTPAQILGIAATTLAVRAVRRRTVAAGPQAARAPEATFQGEPNG